jgi:hypothetical protein
MATTKRGLYVSYNERSNGPIREAVEISNERGCVTWFDTSLLDPAKLVFPTDIIIRITGEERYFRGLLLAVARPERLGEGFADGEHNHRPRAWREQDRQGQTVRSVLFIHGLREVGAPPEVKGLAPPQRPTFIEVAAAG